VNFILCGMPKSGKTTLGRLLGQKIHYRFLDLDHLIEKSYSRKFEESLSCREIYLKKGSFFFRQLEKQEIKDLVIEEKTVLSLGGGTLADVDNVKRVKDIGAMIYLKSSKEVLWSRLEEQGFLASMDVKDPRKSFEEMYRQRIPIFEKEAAFILDVETLTIQEGLEALLSVISHLDKSLEKI